MITESEILIVGGGVAGLSAATQLVESGRRVKLLEGSNRLGGRVCTVRRPSLDYPIEAGAEWLDSSGEVRRLFKRHGLPLVEASGSRWQRQGEWEAFDDLERVIHPLLERADLFTLTDRSLTEALQSFGMDPRWDEARQQLLGYVRGFHAADPDRVSMRWLIETEATQSADASQLRSTSGLDQVIPLLTPPAESCSIHLETVVHEIIWRRGGVEVRAKHDDGDVIYTAPMAVIALPAAILALSSDDPFGVRFDPELTSRRDALAHVPTGDAAKVALIFDAPFWERVQPATNLLFVHSPRAKFPVWWTTRPAPTPMIMGWAAGANANQLGQNGDLLPPALDSLAAIFGITQRELEEKVVDWMAVHWLHEPFARGAYSYVAAGGSDPVGSLGRPIADTLFFAGEYTATGGYNATVEGALRSGRRAASEILQSRVYG